MPHEVRLGIRTAGIELRHEDKEQGFYGYGAADYRTLGEIRRHLVERRIVARRFADAGCGLGRPLYFFSDLHFDELIGYEVSIELCDRARQQLTRVRNRRPGYAKISFECGDVTNILPVDQDLVLFMYNPFDSGPMARLCSRLRAARGNVYIYYVNPVHAAVIEREAVVATEKIHAFIPITFYHLAGSHQGSSS